MLVAEEMLATYNILDHIPLGACILREDYVVLFWNSTLELWTHIPRDQIIGTDIRQSYPLLQEAKFKIRLESIFQGGPPAIFSSLLHRHVIPSTLRDGSPRIQHTTVTCLPTTEGGGFHALLSMEDVTDPSRRMQEHREMRDQALQEVEQRKKAVRVKDEFVSMVSHELRTPLTSITGSLRLLIGGVVPLESQQALAMIDIANRNAERLLRLINDILDLQKIEAGLLQLNKQPLALTPLIRQSLETNAGYGEKYNVTFRLTQALSAAWVYADSDRLLQVMANLLSNAAKFSPPGGTVEVSVLDQQQHAQVRVRDHGPGIPEDFQQCIFQKFAQSTDPESHRKGGTGLGLNISQQIIELHDGQIGFETQQGEGTTFYFNLPVWNGKAPFS